MYKIDKSKFKVVVLAGGFEPEHYGSMLTGENIFKALKEAGFKNVELIDVDENAAEKIIEHKPDFVYMAMFCKWGEDGVMPGFLEVMGIPYSGSGVEASAMCKNKYSFYALAKSIGVKTPEVYFYGDLTDWKSNNSKIVFPAIVKPTYQGYSLGVALIEDESQLQKAVDYAFTFSKKITIEEFIDGTEYTVGVLETGEEKYEALPIIGIQFKKGKIQDTEAKDDPSLMIETISPNIPADLQKNLEDTAVKLFKLTGCTGVSRFDMRVSSSNEIYVLENNTCPGLLNYEQSDLPKQLKSKGLTLADFVEIMIQRGLSRKQNKLEVKFD